jgi:hypothetical protein
MSYTPPCEPPPQFWLCSTCGTIKGPKFHNDWQDPACRLCAHLEHYVKESTELLDIIARLVKIVPTTAEVEGQLRDFPQYVYLYVKSKNGSFPEV